MRYSIRTPKFSNPEAFSSAYCRSCSAACRWKHCCPIAGEAALSPLNQQMIRRRSSIGESVDSKQRIFWLEGQNCGGVVDSLVMLDSFENQLKPT